jgi:phage-related protein
LIEVAPGKITKIYIISSQHQSMKPLNFRASSLSDLMSFSDGAKRRAGFELDKVQRGEQPSDFKPMTSVGKGVEEIRLRDESGAYRVIYVARLADAVYVLHCFQKKTQQTAKRDIDLAAQRLKDLLIEKGQT